jgi:hypothetical protein
VNTVMNIQVPQNVGNYLTSQRIVSFSGTLLHGVRDLSSTAGKVWSLVYGLGWYRDRIPIETRLFSETSRQCLQPTQSPDEGAAAFFPGGKAAEA